MNLNPSHSTPLLLLAALALATTAPAQPAGEPAVPALPRPMAGSAEAAAQSAAQPEQPGQPDRAVIRERLQRRLDEARAAVTRLETAIKDLDAGKPPAEIRQQLDRDRPRPFIDALRQRQGPPRGPSADRGPDREPDRGPDRWPDRGPEANRPPLPPGPVDRPRLMDMLERNNPDFAARLRQLDRDNPEASRRLWQRLEPKLRDYVTEADPEMRTLREADLRNGANLLMANRRLMESKRAGQSQAEIDRQLEGIRTILAERYDLQLKLQQGDIARLERRLAQLRQEATTNAPTDEARKAFIDSRINEMLEAADRPQRPPQDPRP